MHRTKLKKVNILLDLATLLTNKTKHTAQKLAYKRGR